MTVRVRTEVRSGSVLGSELGSGSGSGVAVAVKEESLSIMGSLQEC